MIPAVICRFRILLLLLLILTLAGCAPREKQNFSEDGWQKAVSRTRETDFYAPHQAEDRYFSPWMKMPDKSFLDVLGWKLFPEDHYTKEEMAFLPGVSPNTLARIQSTQGDFILWIGHNTFLVRTGGQYWLTDPIFSERALIPKRKTPPALTLEELNALVKAPNILISHNHYDHLDRKSMKCLPEDSRVFVPQGLAAMVKKMNKPHTQAMDWWEEKILGPGIKLVCLPTQHWSMRINQGRNKSLWVAWLLITPDTTFYFGGDTGYFKGFTETGKKYPDIDYAFMATTAYHPRWFMHYQHMNIPEAVKGFNELGAKYFIPTQWGTFHLGSEPAGFPGLELKRFIQARKLDSSRFKIMDIGEILEITP